MQIAEHQNGAIATLRQGVSSRYLQIRLPSGDVNPIFSGNSICFSQSLGSPITTDHFKAALRNKNAIPTFGARQIQHRPRKIFALKKVKIIPEER